MKIAITAKGAGLGAWLDASFSTCLQIVIVDDHNRFEAWENPFRNESVEGLDLAKKLIQEQVDILITGGISPRASASLGQAGIHVFHAESGSVLELVEAFREGRLPPAG